MQSVSLALLILGSQTPAPSKLRIALLPAQAPPPKVVVLGGRPTEPPPKREAPWVVAVAFDDWGRARLESPGADAILRGLASTKIETYEQLTSHARLKELRDELGVEAVIVPIVVEHGTFADRVYRGLTEEEKRRRRRTRPTSGPRGQPPESPFVSEVETGYRTVLEAIMMDRTGARTLKSTHRTVVDPGPGAERKHSDQAVAALLKPLKLAPRPGSRPPP